MPTSGFGLLRNPATNKSRGFKPSEISSLGLRGLLPAGEPLSLQQQVEMVMATLRRQKDDLCRYEVLSRLGTSDLNLFYAVLTSHLAYTLPLVYTPTVGQACIEYSHLVLPPRGVYLPITAAGTLESILMSLLPLSGPRPKVQAIVVTDGERILGLGDLGANGMGIPVGKLALYTALGGVDPSVTLPITLDVGTNNAVLLADPLYCGLRQTRVTGDAYYAFVDEFVHAVQAVFGSQTLIQWEDFGNTTAFHILEKYQHTAVSFNDDIQGTASVVVAGLLSAPRMTGKPLGGESKYLFFGAGEAGAGIANLLAYAICKADGISIEAAQGKIWLVDSKGLVTSGRGEGIEHHKKAYAHAAPVPPPDTDLVSIITCLKPTALIGVSAQGGAFSRSVVQAMSSINAHPLIFALSNPTSKAECTAEQAYEWSEGRVIFASGSPFDPVTLRVPGQEGRGEEGRGEERSGEEKTFNPGQANNSWIFPAVGLAVLAVGMNHVSDHTMYVAAKALAGRVTEKDLETGCLFPPLETIRDVSAYVAAAVAEDAYEKGVATLQPRPLDMVAHMKASMWQPSYDRSLLADAKM